MPAMRDVFWNAIFEKAKEDRDIVILAADFAAPSLDRFRLELPAQFVNLGIAEQNMMLLAAGMALEGKKPFCYAIAPFLTMRCFEQTRLYAAGMNLPIVMVGVGAGFCYSESGYTHHTLEDIAIMRSLPNMRIFSPSDNKTTGKMVDLALESHSPVYVRLDRYGIDDNGGAEDISSGISVIKPARETTIVATGTMVLNALEAAKLLAEQGVEVGVVDASILPLNKDAFKNAVKDAKTLVTLEEHNISAGLGSHVLEIVSDTGLNMKVRRLGVDLSKGYSVEYGGREYIHEDFGLDAKSVANAVLEEIK